MANGQQKIYDDYGNEIPITGLDPDTLPSNVSLSIGYQAPGITPTPVAYDDDGNPIPQSGAAPPAEPPAAPPATAPQQAGSPYEMPPSFGNTLFAGGKAAFGAGKKAWDWLNEPIIKPPEGMAEIERLTEKEHPYLTGAERFGKNLLFAQTSPLNLGLLALTGGASVAGKAGYEGLSKALEIPGMLTSGAMVGEGGYNVATAKTKAGKAAGAMELVAGALGAREIGGEGKARGEIEVPEEVGKEKYEVPPSDAGEPQHGKVLDKLEQASDLASEGLEDEESPVRTIAREFAADGKLPPLHVVETATQMPNRKMLPPPGTGRTKDLAPAWANSGSADQMLESRDYTRPIVTRLRENGWDKAQVEIGTNIRKLDKITAGMNDAQLKSFGRMVEGKATMEDMALLSKIKNVDLRMQTYRALMDNIFLKAKIARSGKLGYIDDYVTHVMESEPDDFTTGLKQLSGYYQTKEAAKALFTAKELGPPLKGKGKQGDIYGKGMGNIAETRFAKTRQDLIGGAVDYNVNKVGRMYIEAMARETYLRPAIADAKKMIAKLPVDPKTKSSTAKELAQFYVKNLSRYDSAPELNNAFQKAVDVLNNTTSRSMMGFSPRLQALHLMRLGPVWSELGNKYSAVGLENVIKNPAAAYQETARLGMLPAEIMPMRFQTNAEKMNSILNLKSYVDFIDRSIAYNGFKAKYLAEGMKPEDAIQKAITDTKRVTFMVDPARATKGLTPDPSTLMGAARAITLYHKVPFKVAEWMVRSQMQWKSNPAAARRALILMGGAAGTMAAGGPELFHFPLNALETSAAGFGEISKIGYYIAKGDMDKAAEEAALFLTPAGLATRKTLKDLEDLGIW